MHSKKSFTHLCAVSLILFTVSAAHAEEATDSIARQLQEITVRADNPVTRLEGSTMVSVIPGSPLQNAGNALDVLGRLPMINVHDNEISVTGKDNIEIYINGHPMRDINELIQLMSDELKRVELLMAPSAAYAATTGAVIRITTTRNFIRGLSLTDQLQLRKRRTYSVSDYLDLNYRHGAWDYFLSGSFNHDHTKARGTTVNTLEYNGTPVTVGSSQHTDYPVNAGTVKAGFNFARDTQSFGAYYRFNPEHSDFTNTGEEWTDTDIPLDRVISRAITGRSHLANAYYENKFNGRYLFHADGLFRHSHSSTGTETSYPAALLPAVASSECRNSTLWAGKAYTEFPLGKGSFTIGTEDSYTSTASDYTMLNPEVGAYIPSSSSHARQISAALFSSWNASFGPWSMTLGARYDYVDYNFTLNGVKDKDMSRKDHTVTPDISLSYQFSQRASLSLSYKMTTIRPPYSQLTRGLNYVGMHEIEGGNPALRDECMHNVQLFGMWNGFMLQADLTRSLDSYAFVKEIYPAQNLQLLMHPINIDVTAFSCYAVWEKNIKRWMPNVTLGAYRQWLGLGGQKYDRPIFSYSFDNTLTFPHGFIMTTSMSGRSRGDMHTNRFGATYFTMNASVSKHFFNKALTVKFSANDIFNTANNNWTMNTYGVHVTKNQSYDFRGILLNVIYRFQPRQSKYKGGSASEAEMKRL